jgi:hypothetical protein
VKDCAPHSPVNFRSCGSRVIENECGGLSALDYEFLRRSMEDRWRAGYYDVVRTLRHPQVLERPANHEGVLTFDLSADGRK